MNEIGIRISCDRPVCAKRQFGNKKYIIQYFMLMRLTSFHAVALEITTRHICGD